MKEKTWLKFPVLFSLYIAQSIPMSFFSTVIPVIMRQEKYSLESIGLLQLVKLPWIFNPAGQIPELIGHSGLSGTIAYHSPEKELYITGTVNQVAFPDSSFRLAVKLIQKII